MGGGGGLCCNCAFFAAPIIVDIGKKISTLKKVLFFFLNWIKPCGRLHSGFESHKNPNLAQVNANTALFPQGSFISKMTTEKRALHKFVVNHIL